ncbi:hypothetical protein RRF57_008856 [Xylaria bambusicola]|uniref:Uncharacterized protein n=1 Tax=Xylaria bambusicola TaxID=326684 RepID=A0AAN7Z8M0_9PEZI
MHDDDAGWPTITLQHARACGLVIGTSSPAGHMATSHLIEHGGEWVARSHLQHKIYEWVPPVMQTLDHETQHIPTLPYLEHQWQRRRKPR